MTPTPTRTGTPPTPTVTGTIVPNITLSVAVSPSSARINETFTFTIQVRNTGTAAASNALVSDSFSTLLDITGATTTKGTAATNTSNRTVTVSVGTVNPNETVTITITTRVNSSATTTTTQTHTASMTYAVGGVNLSRTSNAVSYQITGSSTLPGTGWGPPVPPQVEPSRPFPWLSLIFAVLGLGALVVGLLVKAVRRERVLFIGIGVWLLLMGLVVGPVGASWLQPPEQVAQAPSSVEEVAPAPASREPESVLQIILPTPEVVETLPDYPVPTPEFTPTPGENGEEPDSSSVERILIPALGVDTVVKYVPYDGFSWKIAGLHQEVAWMGETSWPGLGGNTALAGHITLRDGGNGPFRYLEDIVPGDQVTLFTEKNIYTYQVREQRVVPQTELSVIRSTEATQLTLITCTGWDPAVRYYQDRLVVVADLVQVEPRVVAARGN